MDNHAVLVYALELLQCMLHWQNNLRGQTLQTPMYLTLHKQHVLVTAQTQQENRCMLADDHRWCQVLLSDKSWQLHHLPTCNPPPCRHMPYQLCTHTEGTTYLSTNGTARPTSSTSQP